MRHEALQGHEVEEPPVVAGDLGEATTRLCRRGIRGVEVVAEEREVPPGEQHVTVGVAAVELEPLERVGGGVEVTGERRGPGETSPQPGPGPGVGLHGEGVAVGIAGAEVATGHQAVGAQLEASGPGALRAPGRARQSKVVSALPKAPIAASVSAARST